MEDFEKLMEGSLQKFRKGDKVKGEVVSIVDDKTIAISLGTFTEGIMHLDHYTKDNNVQSFKGLVKIGDVIEVKESKKEYEVFKALKEMKVVCPKWLTLDVANLKGEVIAKPQRDDIDANIRETLIVELYSK